MLKQTLALASLTLSLSANAALYKLTYTSYDYGTLGWFTIDSQDIIDHEGDNALGWRYVLNDYIQGLSFSHNGMSWGTEDIAIGPTTAHYYDFIDSAPTNPGGNGSLAINEFGQRITMYHPDYGIVFGSEAIRGTWESELATVPVPAAAWLFGSALVGLAGIKRKK